MSTFITNRPLITSLLLATCALPIGAHADAGNDIPSCYAINKMEIAPPPTQEEVFFLIDETTVLDDNLQKDLYAITQSLVRPGVKFSILSFSAYAQGRYLDKKFGGVLEQPLPKDARPSIGVKILKNFDACMAGQANYGLSNAYKAEKAILQSATVDLKKSDVLASIAETSRLVKSSQIHKKVVIIVSDMLENSSISSFYSQNNVRRIDPAKEMSTVIKDRMLGDFAGADIYVMGAAIVPETGKMAYRDPKTIGALQDFWAAYFSKSNGNLVEFGMPTLLRPPTN